MTRPTSDSGPGSWQVQPTPTSLRREAAEKSCRMAVADIRRDEPGRAGASPPSPRPSLATKEELDRVLPKPKPRHRALTPEELRNVQLQSQALVTREPHVQMQIHDRHARPTLGHVMAADRRGDPCSCGTDDDPRPCLEHAGTTGHRRHVRPRR
jgi:hypothetical protein